jgi:uncharacterized damage-inducible protein DinB
MKPAQIFSHWRQVRADLLSTLDRFSDQEITFSPFHETWPVGQIALHIADCEENWLHGVVRGEITPWVFYDLKDYPTRRDIFDQLDRVHRKTLVFLDSLEEQDLDVAYATSDGGSYRLGWILWHVLEHEIHHRGELSLIHGLLGREGLDV